MKSIASLLMSYIAIAIMNFFVEGALRDPASANKPSTMPIGEAYKVGQLRGDALDPFQALYLATLGGARALDLGDKIGNLAPGKEADFVVLDLAATPLMTRRLAGAKSLENKLFALTVLGDDRVVARTYLAGVERYRRN